MTEVWLDIPGYEGLYQCSDAGRVKSLPRVIARKDGVLRRYPGQVLTPVVHTHGYRQVILCKDGEKKLTLVHRIVALTFIPNPESLPCINHKNQDKADNRSENLEWCSVAYNNTYGDRVQRIADKKRGSKHSAEAKKKMSEAHHNISEETRRKLSAAARRRITTDATRRKISSYARSRRRGEDGRWLV